MRRWGRVAWVTGPLAVAIASACTGQFTEVGDANDAAPGSQDAHASDGTSTLADATGKDATGESSTTTCTPAKPSASAMTTFKVALQGVNVSDSSTTAWSTLGFDIDDKCTTSASTDVCTLRSGASAATQNDGKNGIDNSFGENIVPIFDSQIGDFFTSGTFYLDVTNGTGVMTYEEQEGPVDIVLAMTVVDAKLDPTAKMFTAIVPTDEMVSDMNAFFGRVSTMLCSGETHDSTDQAIIEASDILIDGTNVAGTPCNGISVGLSYASYTDGVSSPNAGSDPCGD